MQAISPRNDAALAANYRQSLGINLPQLYPQYNPLHLIPNATFGGVSNAPALAIESRFPYHGNGNVWNWSDNLTKIWGKHNFKVGTLHRECHTQRAAHVHGDRRLFLQPRRQQSE